MPEFILKEQFEYCKGYISPEVSIHGHTYKPGAVLQLNYVEGIPTFGLVFQNLIYDNMKFFILQSLITLGFHSHYNAYVLKPAGNQEVVKLGSHCGD